MQQRLARTLQEIGLSEKESLVYLAALRLGPSTPLRLASLSGIKRATVYNVLESLKGKGLLFTQLEGMKKRFVAEGPDRLEALLDSRKALVQKILPDLAALRAVDSDDSVIRYFEGLEAMKSVYESLLKDVKPGEDYLIISNQPAIFDLDRQFFQRFIERRAKLPIKIRMLTTQTEMGREHVRDASRYNLTAKLLPSTKSLSTNLVIIPRRVVVHQLVSPVVVLVAENRSFVQLHRELFEMIWASVP